MDIKLDDVVSKFVVLTIDVPKLMTASTLVQTRGEARRLIRQRAVVINDEVVEKDKLAITNLKIKLEVGKRRRAFITLKP